MSTVIDKRGYLANIEGRRLDLGCGRRKSAPDYVGVDVLDYPEVDVVGDAFEVLRQVPDSALVGVYSSHFLEHISDVPSMLDELARTLRAGGQLEVIVPHFSNPHFYSDLTHRSSFGLYTFSYVAADHIFRRRVPTYGRSAAFRLQSVTLRFKASPPFYARYAVKRVIEMLVNLTRWTQEFYEENICFLIPCYEVRFVLKRD